MKPRIWHHRADGRSLITFFPFPFVNRLCLALFAAAYIMTISMGAVIGAGITPAKAVGMESPLPLEAMQEKVAAASTDSPVWDGPNTGPKAATGKTLAVINEDLRNGGILGVALGIREAAEAIGWQVKLFDAGGKPNGRENAVAEAMKINPDGLILNGTDAKVMHSLILPFAKRGIPIVGWHVGPKAGAMKESPVAVNVSTDPLEVARLTAMAAIVEAEGRAGVVVFTDSNFEIAMAKAEVMAETVRACEECTLLEVRDVAISNSAEAMPAVTRELLDKYGSRWTHGLAINDVYFDYAVPEFIIADQVAQHIQLLSAGDGSSAAFLRIQAGTYQTHTVAEPLNLQGWQLVDELNRLFHSEPVSGYVVPVHLITTANLLKGVGEHFQYDPNNGYQNAYRQIWGR